MVDADRRSPEAKAELRLAATGGVETAVEMIDTVYRLSGTTGIFGSTV